LYLDGDGNGTFNKDADYGFWVAYDSPSHHSFNSYDEVRDADHRVASSAADEDPE
jgi:hypothetical protein